MKILVIAAVCFVSAANAGLFGGSSAGWMGQDTSGWDQQMHQDASGWAEDMQQDSTAWEQQMQEGWAQQMQQGWATEQMQHSRPQQEQKKIIIIKQDQGSQRAAGGSVTISGPTHTIKTIHQVRTLDQGGQILSKMGSSGAQAKVLIVKDVKTAQVQHVMPQMKAGGWQGQMKH